MFVPKMLEACVILFFSLILSYSAIAQVQFSKPSPNTLPKPKHTAPVILKDDQALLPPYLNAFEGGALLNLQNRKGERFSAKQGQFLEHGSRLDHPNHMAVRVWMHENLQWISGGRFRGQVSRDTWDQKGPARFLAVEYGWLAGWLKSTHRDQEWGVVTPHVKLFFKNARYILQVKSWVTELYLLEGEVVTGKGDVYRAGQGVHFRSDQTLETRDWDEGALQDRIAGSYPAFVKLHDLAQADWKADRLKTLYAKIKNDWRKAN